MTSHMIAWFENVNNVTDSELNVVADDILVQPTAERFFVPAEYNHIHKALLLADNITRGRIVTPSLEVRRSRPTIVPHARDAAISLVNPKVYMPANPIELVPGEEISVRVTNPTAGEDTWAILQLAKAALDPIPDGDIRRVRCTSATTLTDSAWTSCTLVPDEQLEAGEYELINFLATGVSVIAARAIIQGQAWRPGVIGFPGASEQVALDFASDWYNVNKPHAMGRFPHNLLPRVQYLASAADTAQVVYLDIVKVG